MVAADLPNATADGSTSRIIATAWVLIRATKWTDSDRVRVWVEDADPEISEDIMGNPSYPACYGSAWSCTRGCLTCCGACCDTSAPREEKVLMDISLTKNATWGNQLLEDQ